MAVFAQQVFVSSKNSNSLGESDTLSSFNDCVTFILFFECES